MTTPQIYALFAMLTCMATLIGISYCTGLKTGKAAGHAACKSFFTGRLLSSHDARKAQAIEITDLREQISRLNGLIADIETAHRLDREGIAQDAEIRIAALARNSTAFTIDDQITLKAIANQLELAASTYTGLGATDRARHLRTTQGRAINLAERLQLTLEHQAQKNTTSRTCQLEPLASGEYMPAAAVDRQFHPEKNLRAVGGAE